MIWRFVRVAKLTDPRCLLLWLGLYLAAGSEGDPFWRDAGAVLSLHLTFVAILAFNLYRGRVEDAVSERKRNRPTAGRAGRDRRVEVVVGLFVIAAVGIPLLLAEPGQAAADAVAIAGYAAAYANRAARRPVALLKPLSMVAAMALATTGCLLALDVPGELLAALVVLVATWRTAWELTLDIDEAPDDRKAGTTTPATVWSRATLLSVVGLTSAVGSVVSAALMANQATDVARRLAVVGLAIVAIGGILVTVLLARRSPTTPARGVGHAVMLALLVGFAAGAVAGRSWAVVAAWLVVVGAQAVRWTRTDLAAARTARGGSVGDVRVAGT